MGGGRESQTCLSLLLLSGKKISLEKEKKEIRRKCSMLVVNINLVGRMRCAEKKSAVTSLGTFSVQYFY